MTAAASVNPDRKRIGSVADVGQAISLAAPGRLLLALPATALLGCWSRIVVGAAPTYFPSAAWGLGPSLLWEYPEPLRSIDSNRRGLGWALVLACVATVVAISSLVADSTDRATGSE